MSCIPCKCNAQLKEQIDAFAEVLKTEAHKLGDHGLSEGEFYNSGLFRGAIERVRGQFSATMREKRFFVQLVLNHLEDQNFISEWHSAGEKNRHDYTVKMPSGKICVIELKGGLDGNNTNIFVRPPHANEFVIWSISSNPGNDPRKSVWSGIHTRLSAEIIDRSQQVDGLAVWDWVCSTVGRPCPKVVQTRERLTELGPFELPPPCIYLFPCTIPSPRNNPNPRPHRVDEVEFLKALHESFHGQDDELNSVTIEAQYISNELCRKTTISRNGQVAKQSEFKPIQRA